MIYICSAYWFTLVRVEWRDVAFCRPCIYVCMYICMYTYIYSVIYIYSAYWLIRVEWRDVAFCRPFGRFRKEETALDVRDRIVAGSYRCVYMCVCMCVCARICTCLCIRQGVEISLGMWIYTCAGRQMHAYINTHAYVGIYTYIFMLIHIHRFLGDYFSHVSDNAKDLITKLLVVDSTKVCMCMYVCMYVCMCVYIICLCVCVFV